MPRGLQIWISSPNLENCRKSPQKKRNEHAVLRKKNRRKWKKRGPKCSDYEPTMENFRSATSSISNKHQTPYDFGRYPCWFYFDMAPGRSLYLRWGSILHDTWSYTCRWNSMVNIDESKWFLQRKAKFSEQTEELHWRSSLAFISENDVSRNSLHRKRVDIGEECVFFTNFPSWHSVFLLCTSLALLFTYTYYKLICPVPDL